jgi:arsenite methyltransferase
MSYKEFIGVRSSLYKEAMSEYPKAREEEGALSLRHLKPQPHEKILEVGAGGGFFTQIIADALRSGTLVATDPSAEQLEDIKNLKRSNIKIIAASADGLPVGVDPLQKGSFDGIWSGGSFHHVPNKSNAFSQFSSLLKKDGRLVILDVFSGSALAKHFDLEVAKYCVTGHEVAFLSEAFADSLCHLYGFAKPTFVHETVNWKFSTKQDLGLFIYKLHAMTARTPEQCYEGAKSILGVREKDGQYHLNWPLTALITHKL